MIHRVIELYSDCTGEVRQLLSEALLYLRGVDKSAFEKCCEVLCDLKRCCPEFTIKITDDKRSYFSGNDNTVIISKNSQENFCTLFHEMTHAFHYYKNGFFVPNDFLQLLDSLRNDMEFQANAVAFLKHLNEKILLFGESKGVNELVEKKFGEGAQIEDELSENSEIIRFIQVLDCVEDMIDAVFRGELHDRGGCYVRDNNSYIEKSFRGSGHGEKYYSDVNMLFVEMLANYGAIINSKYKNDTIEMIRLLFGERLVKLLNDEYLEVTNLKSINVKDNNGGFSRR